MIRLEDVAVQAAALVALAVRSTQLYNETHTNTQQNYKLHRVYLNKININKEHEDAATSCIFFTFFLSFLLIADSIIATFY